MVFTRTKSRCKEWLKSSCIHCTEDPTKPTTVSNRRKSFHQHCYIFTQTRGLHIMVRIYLYIHQDLLIYWTRMTYDLKRSIDLRWLFDPVLYSSLDDLVFVSFNCFTLCICSTILCRWWFWKVCPSFGRISQIFQGTSKHLWSTEKQQIEHNTTLWKRGLLYLLYIVNLKAIFL